MTIMCIAAANYLVELTNEYNKDKSYSDRISMTCKRLQKLLYFSDAEYMKNNDGDSMFKDEFYAWPSGPVIPSVYDSFVQYQTGEMQPVDGEHTPITEKMKIVLKYIFDVTTMIDTVDLVAMSHIDGGPWSKVYSKDDPKHEQIILKDSIYEFYKNREVIS